MKTFFFFGDSITLGVNDPAGGGWVGRFALLASNAGLAVPPATFYNLGVRRHSSRQIRQRWKGEYQVRANNDAVPYLVFCFGTVDMAAPNGSVVVPLTESVDNVASILEAAQKTAPVLMLSAPPVAERAHAARIAELNAAYSKCCLGLNVPFVDLGKRLSSGYIEDLGDGLHPGAAGNTLIARALLECSAMQAWIA